MARSLLDREGDSRGGLQYSLGRVETTRGVVRPRHIMNRTRWIALIAVFLASALSLDAQHGPPDGRVQPKGLLRHEAGAWPGYTLFTPLRSTTTYLIDMEGEVVHRWESDYTPGHSVYLLANGHLLRAGHEPSERAFPGGGAGGRIQEFTWDGAVVWDFLYASDEHLQHHDLEPLPSGNILLIAWEKKSREEAIATGRDPRLLETGQLEEGEMWVDHIVEIEPIAPDGGKVVWEWHAWDHLIQDRDPEKANHGVPAEHPERIDIHADRWRRRASDEELGDELERLRKLGYAGGPPGRPQGMRADWTHVNSIDYNPYLDQILLSVHAFSEIWIIDHSTTTEEAAGSTGGRGGRGGDLLYRWGNPQAFGGGTAEDRVLFGQHDARWVRGKEGEWSVLMFNNGLDRVGGNWSSVDQILLPIDEAGNYLRGEGEAFGPSEPFWSYTDPRRGLFYSSHISGAQRLPNGNTLICTGDQGRFFEVTASGEKVWEYSNPFVQGIYRGPGDRGTAPPPLHRPPNAGAPPNAGVRARGAGAQDSAVFRATRLAPNHPGLARLGK
jgi:hypothetical protein